MVDGKRPGAPHEKEVEDVLEAREVLGRARVALEALKPPGLTV